MAPKREGKKGKHILFLGGKYIGKKGWLDLNQDPMPKFIGVIVEGKGSDEDLVTRVKQAFVKDISARKIPTSYEQALLEQHPDIEILMEKLATELARCEISGRAGTGAADGVLAMLKSKIKKAYNKQTLLGHHALWRKVKFHSPNDAESIDIDEDDDDDSFS
jgi:hypothetical protein